TSDNADLQYKKLKDEIIEYVLQDLNHNVQPEDRSYTRSQSQVVSQKKPFLFLCVIVWFIVVLAVLFFTPDLVFFHLQMIQYWSIDLRYNMVWNYKSQIHYGCNDA
ncbi:hypothetical protein A2U01_0023981, partial [Trifolium medium]|nr:hypothetical protein [Trifolium medium]